MKILRIKALGKRRYAVYFALKGEERAMPLYAGELRRYHVEEGAELPDSVYEEIRLQILNKRALERSEYLLAVKSYSAWELSNKLREGFYPQPVIDHALSFLTGYGLIDDASYTARYIESHGKRKSVRQLRMELAGKGIGKEIIERALESSEQRESEALVNLVARRCQSADLSDQKEWNKQLRYFTAKGFPFDEVKRQLMLYRSK